MPELFTCPHCGQHVRVADHLLGRAVRCPGCNGTLIAGAAPQIRHSTREDDDDSGDHTFRGRQDEDDESDREAADEPRRKPSRKRRRRAEEAVNIPSLLMILIGILALTLTGYFVFAGAGLAPRKEGSNALVILPLVTRLLNVVWAALVIAGGILMRSFRMRQLVIGSAVVAMLPFSVCCIVGIPVGAWVLVTVTQPDVKDAFQ